MRTAPLCVLVAAIVSVSAPASRAMFMAPEGTPVDRLVANITKYVEEHPEDANAHYLLGRVHALAFVHNRGVVGTYQRGPAEPGKLPNVADDHLQRWVRPAGAGPGRGPGQEPKPEPLTDEQKVTHLAASIASYVKAIELDPKPAHYHNGLAFVLDKGRPFADRVAPPKVRTTPGEPTHDQAAAAYKSLAEQPDEDKSVRSMLLNSYWREAAIEKYLDAYNRARENDSKIQHQPLAGMNSLVSFEAGTNYLALLKERELTEGEKLSAADVEKHLADLRGKPQGPITPIVFCMSDARPLHALLDADRVVRFDLDGDGHAELRPWVRPDAAILCWDPHGNGMITSGKQLFGSVSFHLYPGDGYTAMNLLDDNRDGELAGDELTGLALWFDRNSNGVSDPGEVVPIERSPVAGLSTRAVSEIDGAPMNPFGLRLRDGRTLPTYDWIAPAIDSPTD